MSLALAATITASCSKEPLPDTNRQVPITFNVLASGYLPLTKAPISSDGSGYLSSTLTGVQLLRSDAASTPDWSGTPSPISATIAATTGQVTPSPTQYYNVNHSLKSFFLAYYPAATSTSAGKANFTITGDEDIIVSNAVDKGTATVPLSNTFSFTHKLTKLNIYVKTSNTGKYGTSVSSITVNTPTNLELTLSTQAIAASSTPNNQNLSVKGTFPVTINQTSFVYAGYLMVLPGSVTTTIGTITVVTNKKTCTGTSITITNGVTVAGNEHTINITIG